MLRVDRPTQPLSLSGPRSGTPSVIQLQNTQLTTTGRRKTLTRKKPETMVVIMLGWKWDLEVKKAIQWLHMLIEDHLPSS